MSDRGILRRSAEYLGFVSPEVSEPVPETRQSGNGIIPPSRSDFSNVSVDQALSIGAVYRSIFILVTAVAQLELTAVRNGREMKTAPPLIRQPNVYDTSTALIEETVFSLAAHGNTYWRTYRSDSSSPVQSIKVLDPNEVRIEEDKEKGTVKYFWENKELKPHQIKHLKLIRRPGKVKGTGPIQQNCQELAGVLRLRKFADEWFDSSGVPPGYLETDQQLSPEESARFAEAWKKFLREHGIPVLSNGLAYKHLHIKPADAQFLEVQQAAVVGIARLFGIPAMHLLAELTGTSNTYLNLEQANIVWMQTTLIRYANEIENALSDLLPRGTKAKFKMDSILRADSVTKWNVIESQVEVGYTSGAELRELEGKNPLPKPEKEETDDTDNE